MRRLAAAVALLVVAGCSGGSSWTSVALPGGGRVHSIAFVGGRWYVAGSAVDPSARVLVRWWHAAALDGAWHRGGLVTTFADGRRARLFGFAGDGAGRVAALGNATSALHGNPRPVAYRLDGDRLVETYLPRELFGGPRTLNVTELVASSTTGFVVGGTRTATDGRQVAQVWHASTLPDWERLDDQPALESAPGEQLWGRGVAAGPRGAVLVGASYRYDGPGTDHANGVAFTSPDGRAWQRTDDGLGGPGRQELDDIVALGRTGWLALGRRNGRLTLWSSATGTTWTVRSTLPYAGAAATIATDDRGMTVVVGAPGPRLWRSRDAGRTWTSIDRPSGTSSATAPVLATDGATLVVAVDTQVWRARL